MKRVERSSAAGADEEIPKEDASPKAKRTKLSSEEVPLDGRAKALRMMSKFGFKQGDALGKRKTNDG